ncbi:TIGR04255 family protein [uncultured Tolumonas sp.]|uniref:TIGR04255 family protein n=1 Tax=uncultured Tolumonas sp. TaxID=263765 RepID=UPI002A0A8F2E|nr:TIGR04255 family protein [uncultured Tolumonas sp.]
MANPPVYYALAQVQFNPIAAMSKYVDEIQDLLRIKGYTLFEAQTSIQLQLLSPNQAPTQAQHMTWFFTKEDRTAGIILTTATLAFHTTHYETSHEFLESLLEALKTVHSIVTLAHINRMGMRYLDAVLPNESESVDDYLKDGLHGIDFNSSRKYSLSESVYETETSPLVQHGTLISRIYRQESLLVFPPDLIPSGLVMMEKFKTTEPVSHAVIDTDHFVEGSMGLDLPKLEEQLNSLHTGVRAVFDAIITDKAKHAWL